MHGRKVLIANALVILQLSYLSKKGTDFEFEFPFFACKGTT